MHIFKSLPAADLVPISRSGRRLDPVPAAPTTDFTVVASGLMRQLGWLVIESVREARNAGDREAAARFSRMAPLTLSQGQKRELLDYLFGNQSGPPAYYRVARVPWAIEQVNLSLPVRTHR